MSSLHAHAGANTCFKGGSNVKGEALFGTPRYPPALFVLVSNFAALHMDKLVTSSPLGRVVPTNVSVLHNHIPCGVPMFSFV